MEIPCGQSKRLELGRVKMIEDSRCVARTREKFSGQVRETRHGVDGAVLDV